MRQIAPLAEAIIRLMILAISHHFTDDTALPPIDFTHCRFSQHFHTAGSPIITDSLLIFSTADNIAI